MHGGRLFLIMKDEEKETNLRFKVRITAESADGTPLIDIEVEELLEKALDPETLTRLPHRVNNLFEDRVLVEVRRGLRRWMDEHIPSHPKSFESEYCLRCDRNDEVLSALEWMNPQPSTDRQREWTGRMASIVMARMTNEKVR